MIRRQPRAVEAIIQLAEYIAVDSASAAERFLISTEETFKQLERMPGMGRLYASANARLARIRVWSVKGFRNHLIFYRPFDGGIEILTVLHGARDIENVLEDEI